MPDRPQPDRVRPVVLVHGAWHGAWCWAALQAELDRRGVPSYAVDLPGHGASTAPLGDLHGDAAAVTAVVDRVASRSPDGVVLVGHSYGGAVVTHAAAHAADGAVARLVYVAAFALDDGESLMGFLTTAPREEVALAAAVVQHEDGTSTIDPSRAAAALYGTCPPEVVPAAVARLSPQPMVTFVQPVEGAPRTRIPSTYVRCLRDEAVHPGHQAILAARCTETVELDTDHSPFLSATAAVADVVERAARA